MLGGLEHSILSFCSPLFIQMNAAGKMMSTEGVLNPQPLIHKSSAFTTRTGYSAKKN